jgi:hypothetical protein
MSQRHCLLYKLIQQVQDAGALHRTFNVEPLYLQHENSGMAIDYMVAFKIILLNP